MGYYLGQSYMVPRAGYGAQGGFFSGITHFLGGAVSRIGQAAVGFKTGGVLGAVGGALQTVAQHPIVSAAAGAATGAAVASVVSGRSGAAATAAAPGGLTVHGHLHVGGRRTKGAMAIGGRRHRRMNPCNVHALRRAIRRAHGFERIAKKVLHFTSPQSKRKPHGFKRARKRTSV